MAKTKRGSNIKKIPNWRGTCPICNRSSVKVLWTAVQDGQSIKVCKHCGN